MADQNSGNDRMNFGHFLDKAVWALLIGGVGLMLTNIGQLNKHVNSINDQTLILVERSSTYQKSLENLTTRIDALEAWRQADILAHAMQQQSERDLQVQAQADRPRRTGVTIRSVVR